MAPRLLKQVVSLIGVYTLVCLAAWCRATAADEPDFLVRAQLKTMVERLSSTAGHCSASSVHINAVDLKSLGTRTNYPNTTTVTIYLKNDIHLSSSMLFDARWSCTILLGVPTGGRTITYPQGDRPALRIYGVNNMLVHGINFAIKLSKATTVGCKGLPDYGTWSYDSPVCPTVYIWNSYSVQMTTGALTGRLDIMRSTRCLVDSMTLSNLVGGDLNPANLRMGYSGNAAKLVLCNNVISNNRFIGGVGSATGVLLYYGTVGATVKNNAFTNFGFSGILCGGGIHFVADCMLNTFANNFITFATSGALKPLGDSGGLYFDCHWVNPANKVSCNYVTNGQHCIYSDYLTSGLTVSSAVCINCQDGIKMNGGRYNHISNVVLIGNTQQAGWISCQNYEENNCRLDPGTYWEAQRLKYYNTFRWKKYWPYLSTVCSTTQYDGVQCNPKGGANATATGHCSGLPVGNVVEVTMIQPRMSAGLIPSGFRFCEDLPNVPRLNRVQQYSYPSIAAAGFANPARGDFGLKSTSRLRWAQPHFASCPRASVGPQKVGFQTYLNAFNAAVTPAHAATQAAKVVRASSFMRAAAAAGGNATTAAARSSAVGRSMSKENWPHFVDMGQGLTV